MDHYNDDGDDEWNGSCVQSTVQTVRIMATDTERERRRERERSS